ncbi:MAG TPA: hypothetical protein VGP85_07000 [Pyrinomonadaceae bacterium]|jgi:hypothetical protein|nr:hypothetical protein [Pyrinomonadaceae bacterium]
MTKNQKIALGCGGAGCLGLIVVAVVGLVVWLVLLPARTKREFNYNFSTNGNSNLNSNSTPNVNAASNANNDNSSSSEMSDEDKHRLYQAASMTGDPEMLRRVSVKLGLMNSDFTTSDRYLSFVRDHVSWALRNGEFISSLDTKEKAAAYVNEHFPE